MSLIGQHFKRREPQGDPGDVVVLRGASVETQNEIVTDVLVVASATYGAIPEAWDDAVVTFTATELVEEYRPLADAELATLALTQAADAQEAAEKSADRDSPWAYTLPVQRRTGKGNRG